MFRKVLIANRGEIALRVARTCRELDVRTVVCHSEADAASAAVRFADEAVCVGPAASRKSYLNAAAVLTAALQTGAEAIHPGYGFLSEDPDFAEACADAGVVLIGPPPDVMATLGNKASARALMARAGLPLLPGGVEPVDAAQAQELADGIGYPVIVKAVAGGGGRGMAVVHSRADFAAVYAGTRATAESLFGDGRVYVERYLRTARHVEVQVLCDTHGAAVHLGERDCSVQRRHQKLVEETPAPNLPPGLAERMGEAAVRGALAAGYVGAGTWEFLVDEEGRFYFMEVNCRIQVEHPVTEAVTGLDLVRAQLEIAAGLPLDVARCGARRDGVAIECRINAEDPTRDFAPTPGVLSEFIPPGGPFVRVDTHAFTGAEVVPFYDSLLAKLVVWGPDREQAIARMRRALGELHVKGVCTTASFLDGVLATPEFGAGRHHTSLVAELLGQA
ncbi:acetyl-CoA carboxylase biotin carboxylase subunit [Saccharothrix tamanrassetensis]|uniref:biotin carboxylase n=1 Tax=Saccharothrix tamanrassetensis TaxID=1051531 RepID=A0A841CUD5_9PSEU|nr:acetyl-CoA carboxylase biotin carboxylase subunit [Saccharothrix tamanrassetensis]MBB5959555.1 acetyl-CoA carboxylase biotin carboxylase subunit [Saccharothrix tamanrassetensis]